MTDCRIYVACLASYNAGRLHGVWVEDCTDLDSMQDTVNAMLRASPEPNVTVTCPRCDGEKRLQLRTGERIGNEDVTALTDCPDCKGSGKVPSSEEYAIHDHEGFGGLVEEYTPMTRVAELAAAIEKHGAAFLAYLGNLGNDSDIAEAVDGFQDAYQGEWDSERAFAENLLDDMGELKDDSMLARYFDYDAFARDLFISDYWRDSDTGAVFRNC